MNSAPAVMSALGGDKREIATAPVISANTKKISPIIAPQRKATSAVASTRPQNRKEYRLMAHPERILAARSFEPSAATEMRLGK